jgi:cytochrome bd-type quinol oxidase subunit 1
MRREVLVIVSGAILSFLLASGGHWLVYRLVSGTHESYKDDLVEISIIQTLAILPLMSILVGAFVAALLPRKPWLAAGVCLLPLTVYLLYLAGPDGAMILLCLIYLSLSIMMALLVSWLRKRKEQGRRQQG